MQKKILISFWRGYYSIYYVIIIIIRFDYNNDQNTAGKITC